MNCLLNGKKIKDGGKMMELSSSRPAWIEIDLDALKNNYNIIRKKIPNSSKVAAVVKADAYGHGAVKIAAELEKLGADYFCVGSPDEGIELRKAGIKKDIIVLAEVLKTQYQDILEGDLIQTVASFETLTGLNKVAAEFNKTIRVHLKIDSGMGRIGFLNSDIKKLINKLKNLKQLKVEGIFSHFARADEADKSYSFKQLNKFDKVLAKFEKSNFDIELKHIANSAAVIDLEASYLDLVRPGIMLYGLQPSKELNNEVDLKSILSFKTKVVQIRNLQQDTPISYGSIYKTDSKEKVAVLPVGYKDGYPRLLSNRGEVLIKGKRAPIRGRICMGQTIVSIEDIEDVEIGDEVVLIGKQSNDQIRASEIAELASTISYEIVCNLDRNLKRVYLKNQ
jgi:alanine racemase